MAGRDDPGAVRAHRTPTHQAGMAGEGDAARCRQSHPISSASCPRWQRRSRCRRGSPHTCTHQVGVACEGVQLLTAGRIPYLQRCVVAGGDDPGAVRAHRTSMHRAGVAGEFPQLLPGSRVPIFSVLSSLAETIHLPSGLTAHPRHHFCGLSGCAVPSRWLRPRS